MRQNVSQEGLIGSDQWPDRSRVPGLPGLQGDRTPPAGSHYSHLWFTWITPAMNVNQRFARQNRGCALHSGASSPLWITWVTRAQGEGSRSQKKIAVTPGEARILFFHAALPLVKTDPCDPCEPRSDIPSPGTPVRHPVAHRLGTRWAYIGPG